jgi:hypothetical protein
MMRFDFFYKINYFYDFGLFVIYDGPAVGM